MTMTARGGRGGPTTTTTGTEPYETALMATVTITRKEAIHGWLPEVCALTGEPTDGVKPRTFYWQPAWVFALLPLALVPCLIVVYCLRKSMTVRLPLAPHKHGHWGWRMAVGCVAVAATALTFLFSTVFVSSDNPKVADPGRVVMIAGGVGFVLSLVLFAVLTVTGIHPTKITHDGITLAGVHQNFVDALEEEREQDEQAARREEEDYRREKERKREARDRRAEREEREEREARDRRPVPIARRVSPPSPPNE